ncbi:MAG: GAF domain-containing protein [Saprospiraceae bacterium]|nr:GAF domain-containing protein [Saprospiraceae bacterium]
MVKDAFRIAELEKLLAERTADLIQRSEELAVISSVQEALVREMDMQSIYDLVGEKIRELFDAQAVIIATFDHETETEHFQYTIENGERFYPESRPINKLRKHLIDSKQKIIINTKDEASEWFGKEVVPGTKYILSGVFVPLISGGMVTSYVSLQNVERENAFSDSEVRLLETLSNSMSAALQNARLLKETEQRTAELAVINSVQEGLAKELDMQSIYDLVGYRIQELFDAQVVGIATFDHNKQEESIQYLIEKGERYYPKSMPLNTLRKHLIQTREKIVINKNFESVASAFGVKKVPGTEYPKSAVYVPLVIGDKVIGYTSLQNIDKENAFSDADVRLLETLANTMSTALENARLFDETQRLLKITEERAQELDILNSVGEAMAKTLDVITVTHIVGEKVRAIFDADITEILLWDAATDLILVPYAYAGGLQEVEPFQMGKGLTSKVILSKKPLLIGTIQEALDLGALMPKDEDKAEAYMAVPIIAGEKLLGVVSVQSYKKNVFNESHVRLLSTLSASMGTALENARLFDETNRLLKETEQRTAELAVINSVQEGLVAQMDIQSIYDLVGEKIREIFDAQVVDIVTYDAGTNLIEDRYAYEKGDRTMLGPREINGFRKYVATSKQMLVHNENIDQAMLEFGNKVLIGEVPKSHIYVPMIAGGEVKGIISLQNLDHEHAFSDSDIKLITTLSNSMSVALESARLFDETTRLLKETEQRTAELALINSVQDGLAKELEMDGIYNLVGEKIREIFNAQIIDITTYDKVKNLIEDKYVYEKGDRTMFGPREPVGFTSHVIRTGELILINENLVAKSKEYNSITVYGESAKSAVWVPLISGNDVKGVISLQDPDREQAFGEGDVNLLKTLANSMSIALESAGRLFETTRLLKETEQRTAELAVINSVQEGLAKELDIQSIYHLVGEKIREIFNAQVIDIVIYDPKQDLIEDRYAYEKGDTTLLGLRKPGGIRKHVIETGQLVAVNRDTEKISKQYDNDILIGEIPKSFVMVPMVSGGKVNGVISLQDLDHEDAFSDSNVKLITTLANSMSIALESAGRLFETTRLLKETEQRTAELAVINSVQEGLAKELDIQSIYHLVGEKIREIFNAQVIDIVTYDPRLDLIEDRYSFEKGDTTLLGPRKPGGLRKHVIETGQLVTANRDAEKISQQYDNDVLIGEVPKSFVMVPMISGGKVSGIISLQDLDNEDAFSEANIKLITTLANSMSVALESARLFDETARLLKETEQRTRELSVINSVQAGLAKELDMNGIYELVGEKMREIFNAQVFDIAVYDKSTNLIEDKYNYEMGDNSLLPPRPLIGFRKWVIENCQPLMINNDIEKASLELGNVVMTGEATKSVVFVPILSGGESNGVMSLQSNDENAFTDADVRLLTTLGNSMTVSLENARLFDETSRLLKETELRTSELAIINSVQEGLASKLDIQAIYDLVGDKIRDVFDTQGISISYYDREKNFITHPYYLFKGDRIEELGFELGKGLTSHIIQTAQPLLINENAIERFKELGAVFAVDETEETAKSWVGVPLISGGMVRGTIRLENYEKEHAYSESDVSLLQTLANSMSVALENARLFDETNLLLKETKQRTTELAVINSVQEGLAKELDIQGIYDLVGDRLCELFPDTQTLVIRTFDNQAEIEHFHYAIEKGERLSIEPRPYIWASKLIINNHKSIHVNENYVKTAIKYGGTGVTKGKPPKSAVFVPMMAGDIVRGSVSLQNVDKEHAFSESDLRLLTTITNSMSVALENARLFDETTLLLSESKQRATELSTVNNITKVLATQLDPADLVQMVGDQLKDLFNANIVYIALLNVKTNIVHFPYQHGDDMDPLILGEGLTSKIILTGEPILINKDLRELRKKMGIQLIGVEAASYLGVPIPLGEDIIGVLSVQSTEQENRFDENDLRLLTTIASSVGVALNNATLFEDVKVAKMEAEAASKAAEKANEAKSAFLSTVSHELRTPLTSVLGFAKIIRKRLDERIFPVVDRSDAKTDKTINQISENLQVVISEGERLTHLINDVLDLAKIEAGKMEWNQENVSMSEVAERAIAATTSLFDQKAIRLVKKIDASLPEIKGDKDKLIQVMINLISNSVKFTEEGTVTCHVFMDKKSL